MIFTLLTSTILFLALCISSWIVLVHNSAATIKYAANIEWIRSNRHVGAMMGKDRWLITSKKMYSLAKQIMLTSTTSMCLLIQSTIISTCAFLDGCELLISATFIAYMVAIWLITLCLHIHQTMLAKQSNDHLIQVKQWVSSNLPQFSDRVMNDITKELIIQGNTVTLQPNSKFYDPSNPNYTVVHVDTVGNIKIRCTDSSDTIDVRLSDVSLPELQDDTNS